MKQQSRDNSRLNKRIPPKQTFIENAEENDWDIYNKVRCKTANKYTNAGRRKISAPDKPTRQYPKERIEQEKRRQRNTFEHQENDDKKDESMNLFNKIALVAIRIGNNLKKKPEYILGIIGVVAVSIACIVFISAFTSDEYEEHHYKDNSPATPVFVDNTGDANTTMITLPPTEQTVIIDIYDGCEDSPKVMELQERLVEIGYLVSDEFTEHFGSSTKQAVERFQLLNGFEVNGRVDTELWNKIFSNDYVEYTLQEGMQGDDIYELQERLRDLGYISFAPTGYYGTDTASALKVFQENHNLTVSGKIDEATSEKLYSDDVISLYYKKGDEGEEIKTFQIRLKELGYITFEPDGIYGSGTLAAVKQFQNKNDLTSDGYIGFQTKEVLLSDNAKKNVLSDGDRGDAVTKLQDRLVKLGYINKTTGYYGSDTAKAVKNFQNQHGLSADGMAGVNTINKLFSDDAQKAKKQVIVGQSSKIDNFIGKARSKLGCKYVLGTKGPSKFDCSGLVYWCLNQVGVNQRYVTSVVWRTEGNYKTIKDIDDVRAGDVICFAPHHCGIAISSDTMIDASSDYG